LFYLTEIAELATRLAIQAGDEADVVVEVGLHGLRGRHLTMGDNGRELHQDYRFDQPMLQLSREYEPDLLVADPRGAAVEMSQFLLKRSGLNLSDSVLAEYQGELVGRARGG
jgi:hypothetical protein